jgi:large subunit ribosomal protein L4
MATANLYSQTGETKGTVELPSALFEQAVHEQAIHAAVRCYLANQRQGTHATKTRAEVSYSGRKLSRHYGYRLPRKVKRLALTSALSDRAANARVYVVEDLQLDAPRTAAMAKLLQALSLAGRHTLFVLPAGDETVWKSLRNLKGVRVLRSHELNAYTVLWADNLVFTQSALSGAEEVFGS